MKQCGIPQLPDISTRLFTDTFILFLGFVKRVFMCMHFFFFAVPCVVTVATLCCIIMGCVFVLDQRCRLSLHASSGLTS